MRTSWVKGGCALVTVRNERHWRDARRQSLATNDQIDFGAVRRKCSFDVSHRDGCIQRRAEATAGDAANDPAIFVGDLAAFAGGCAALGANADPFARDTVE